MLVQCICGILTLFIIKLIISRARVEKHLKKFVTPPGDKVLRHWYVFREKNDMLPKITDLIIKYGTRLRLCLGAISILFIADKQFLKLLLGTSTIMDKDETYKKIEPWLGTGLLTCQREKWEKTRKILTPAFHLHVLEKYICNFQQPVSILINKLQRYADEDPFDVYPLLKLCTLDIICETAMGTKVNAQDNEESDYVRSVKEMLRIVQDRSQSLLKHSDFFFFVFSRDFWKQKRALSVLHGFTREVINRKKLEKENTVKRNVTNEKEKLSFIDLLLKSKIGDRPLSDKEIAHEVDTFMFAGHDTTAAGVSFTLYCLSKHKSAQGAVADELNKIFGEDDRYPTLQDLQNMQYLNLVIKESLRLYPPVPIYIRSSEVDVQLGEWTIPKNVSVAVFAYGVHRNPEYFPDPMKFIPERFEDEIEPYTYIPFSSGSRNCIGQKFAVLEMKAIISTVVRNFEILAVDGYEPIPVTNVVLGSANGIQIRLTKKAKIVSKLESIK